MSYVNVMAIRQLKSLQSLILRKLTAHNRNTVWYRLLEWSIQVGMQFCL